jgi:hypothetical protein
MIFAAGAGVFAECLKRAFLKSPGVLRLVLTYVTEDWTDAIGVRQASLLFSHHWPGPGRVKSLFAATARAWSGELFEECRQ